MPGLDAMQRRIQQPAPSQAAKPKFVPSDELQTMLEAVNQLRTAGDQQRAQALPQLQQAIDIQLNKELDAAGIPSAEQIQGGK